MILVVVVSGMGICVVVCVSGERDMDTVTVIGSRPDAPVTAMHWARARAAHADQFIDREAVRAQVGQPSSLTGTLVLALRTISLTIRE